MRKEPDENARGRHDIPCLVADERRGERVGGERECDGSDAPLVPRIDDGKERARSLVCNANRRYGGYNPKN